MQKIPIDKTRYRFFSRVNNGGGDNMFNAWKLTQKEPLLKEVKK